MAHRQLLKAINRAAILNAIKAHGAIARTDIANVTGLSPATVTGLTAELIEDGLIYEKQAGESRGGRRPILLALDASGANVIGIKLAEDDATLALTDLNAEIVAQHTVPLKKRDPKSVARQLGRGVGELLETAHVRRSRVLGVGVGLAGLIDSQAGICRVSPHMGWQEVPFAQFLEQELECIVYLDNNVNTLTLVELLYGMGQQVRDFVVITVGRGVGMGIVTHGQIYRGASGGAGELGHTVIDPEGFVCKCGKRGCLETFVADPWLVRRAQIDGLSVSTPDELASLAQDGNAVAREVFDTAGQALGRALANLVNLFNPSLIIVSGEGVRAGDLLFGPMREALRRHTFAHLGDDARLCIEPLREETWARGAASLVLGKIFSMPQLS